ncbi:hypothetical protein [Burkholderia pseudomallei]|uniref:hypothetical protein n=1 Tax=Burkholderia pseudomallei TaxID=28450 RepID=UPI001E390683|nr:hypothetical protein [Burkholderia pseudomallei]
MYQIDNASAATSQPASTAAGTAGFFTDGNPATATPATIVPAEWLNSVMMELINVVNAGGVTPTKNQFNNVLTALKNSFSPVVGSARNLVMGVGTASATATLTADEIIVETALGGQTYRLANFNKTINLATTGAGGMDTGSAPTSGYVALYAIYNPTTGASALLAKNATSAVQPNVYGGANMPAGYTASALVSVWPTNGSGQFVVGFQRDRSISINSVTVLSTSVTQASPTALSVSSAIPPNAVGISGTIAASSSAAATTSIQLNPIASINVGIQGINFSSTSASGGGSSGVFRNLQVSSPQTIYYTSSNSAGTPTYAIAVMGYDF